MAKKVRPYILDIREAEPNGGGHRITVPVGSRFVDAIAHDGLPVILVEDSGAALTEVWTLRVRRIALPNIPPAYAEYPDTATLLGVIPSLRLVVLRA